MKKRILHDIKVIFLTILSVAIVLLIAFIIFNYVDGYRYYVVYKVGSINLNYEFSSSERNSDIFNCTKEDILRCLERYHDYIQDEEEYQKLYQVVENKDESSIFVISRGAPILYIEYYHDVDGLFCIPVCGNDQPGRLYVYCVYREIPEIG